jgi:hypothetical protein
MAAVNLEDNEWSYVLGVLGERPWREANAVLMKIGTQLRMQQHQARNPDARFQTYPQGEHSEKVPPMAAYPGERGETRILDGSSDRDG